MGQFKKIQQMQRPKAQPIQPGQQIHVDLKNATQRECECGCKLFVPAVTVYTVSALVSPTGQELLAQQPVLVCLECRKVFKGGL
jgi:hypothetical protein